MALLFLAALIGIPLIEIFVFVQVGSEIGALNTIIITIVTAIVGVALIRMQGLDVLMRAQTTLNKRESPVNEIFEGFLLAIGGLFLLIPGFVTDAIGLLLLIPPLRRLFAGYMARHSKIVTAGFHGRNAQSRDTVIDGDYEVIDEDPERLGSGEDTQNPDSPWRKEK
mgnify:CR=1 FL=1